ncbi:MAG: hypothetical protein ACO24G_03645 [Burkholderiaceae bacterium]|jgi:hypothetical protein
MEKHPPDRYYPPGLEWWLLKRMPRFSLVGLLGFGLAWLLVRLWPYADDLAQAETRMQRGEFALLGAFIFFVTMVVTVVIGCVFVLIMKGPRYSADSYRVEDAERPGETSGKGTTEDSTEGSRPPPPPR